MDFTLDLILVRHAGGSSRKLEYVIALSKFLKFYEKL